MVRLCQAMVLLALANGNFVSCQISTGSEEKCMAYTPYAYLNETLSTTVPPRSMHLKISIKNGY